MLATSVKLMGLLHAAIDVSNMRESIAFYRSVFGMSVLRERSEEVRQVWLGREDEPEIQLQNGGDSIGPTGVNHVAMRVEDVDRICDNLGGDQIEMEPETFPSYGARAAFIEDPDGYTYELIQKIE